MDFFYQTLSSFLIASGVFYLYHRMLKINFQAILGINSAKPNVIIILISTFRMLIIAVFLYLIIVKLKQNIWGVLLALISYQLVLLLSGFWKIKSSNKDNT